MRRPKNAGFRVAVCVRAVALTQLFHSVSAQDWRQAAVLRVLAFRLPPADSSVSSAVLLRRTHPTLALGCVRRYFSAASFVVRVQGSGFSAASSVEFRVRV